MFPRFSAWLNYQLLFGMAKIEPSFARVKIENAAHQHVT